MKSQERTWASGHSLRAGGAGSPCKLQSVGEGHRQPFSGKVKDSCGLSAEEGGLGPEQELHIQDMA